MTSIVTGSVSSFSSNVLWQENKTNYDLGLNESDIATNVVAQYGNAIDAELKAINRASNGELPWNSGSFSNSILVGGTYYVSVGASTASAVFYDGSTIYLGDNSNTLSFRSDSSLNFGNSITSTSGTFDHLVLSYSSGIYGKLVGEASNDSLVDLIQLSTDSIASIGNSNIDIESSASLSHKFVVSSTSSLEIYSSSIRLSKGGTTGRFDVGFYDNDGESGRIGWDHDVDRFTIGNPVPFLEMDDSVFKPDNGAAIDLGTTSEPFYNIIALSGTFQTLLNIGNAKIREYSTIQDAQVSGTNDGLSVGDFGIISATGNIWKVDSATGTTSEWIPANGVIDVKDFGATGDNSTNDTTNLQAALDFADAYPTPGGGALIYLSPGDYRISASLEVGGETKFFGAGNLVSRIRVTGAGGFPLLSASNVTQTKISSMGFEGTGQLSNEAALYFDNCSHFSLSDLDIRTIGTGTLYTNGSESGRINDCTYINTTFAAIVEGSSNSTSFYQCRSVNASGSHFTFDAVSLCSAVDCVAEAIDNSEIGFNVIATTGQSIRNNVVRCRAESGTSSGVGFVASGSGAFNVFYTSFIDNYNVDLDNTYVDYGIDTRIINRSRYYNPLISADPEQTPGDNVGRLRYELTGSNLDTEPEVFNPVNHNFSTGVDGNPVMFRRNICSLHCGSSNGVTATTPHYQAWQGEVGSASTAGARSQQLMSKAGRIISAAVNSNGNLGSTTLEVLVNGSTIGVSGTQTVGAGAANGGIFDLSSDTSDQHWDRGDTLTIGVTPTNTVGAVVMVELVVEYDMRTTGL